MNGGPGGARERVFLCRNYTAALRGLCMLMIVFSHTANEFMDIMERCGAVWTLESGRYATGVFFFLSGYGITLSMGRNTVGGAYLWRHLLRLLLPYLIFWAAYAAAGLVVRGTLDAALMLDFVSLKMPFVDAWFFRTILVVYVVYITLAMRFGRRAGVILASAVAVYVPAMALCGMGSWWWDTIACFPLGIAYAAFRPLRRRLRFPAMAGLVLVFAAVQVFCPSAVLRLVALPVVLCVFLAHLSTAVVAMPRLPLLSFVGGNSLHFYFMEQIPIDYCDSEAAGFAAYVVGGTVLTAALACLGSRVEKAVSEFVAGRSASAGGGANKGFDA